MTTNLSLISEPSRVCHVSAVMNKIMDMLVGKFVYIFLDYDGTLTPIVPDPPKATLSNDMHSTLIELVSIFPVGIVTGRGRSVISDFLGADLTKKVHLACSHGFDISITTGECLKVGESDHMSELKRFKTYLVEHMPEFPSGCLIEDTGFSVSLHYRHVPLEFHSSVQSKLLECVRRFSGITVSGGKLVFEIRLNLEWNKGLAVQWILEHTHCPDNVCVIYIGDDITDEDAFRAIKEYPNSLPIIVSDKLSRETTACLRLRDPDEVMQFLGQLTHTFKNFK